MVYAILITGLLVVVFLLGFGSLHQVPADEIQALVIFGEVRAILAPGKRHFVPPLLAKTYEIDTESYTIEKDGERIDVPEKFEHTIDTLEQKQHRTF